MIIYRHRVNTIRELQDTPAAEGVEIDLRDYDGDIVLQHEPLKGGERFEDFLAHYHHASIILNVKCEGIEDAVLRAVRARGISDFFFLDCSLPAMVKLMRKGVSQMAVRFSEHEPIEAALAFAGKAEWAWIDTFTKLPLTPSGHETLKRHFKLCLVSPELQGHPPAEVERCQEQLRDLPIDGVCTDWPERWARFEPAGTPTA